MKLLPFFIFLISVSRLAAQFPLITSWDYRYGGTGGDGLYIIEQTPDTGFILGGASLSGVSGDKTQPLWGGINDQDYWIVKVDSSGLLQWEKAFGGTDLDAFAQLCQTTDNGYLLAGYSTSQVSGDKTEPTWGGTNDYDYWILKIDSAGNKLWDRNYGGTGLDVLTCVAATADSGFILGGYSGSQASGNKSEPTWGGPGDFDYWIVKVDSAGNFQWEKNYGGTAQDELYSIRQTTDGGYILGGWTLSGLNGDKTELSQGLKDYWIVKIDSAGDYQWDQGIGGSNADELRYIQQTPDHGYILGGQSRSSLSGDKSQSSFGDYDYWIVKLDSTGATQWDADFGGTLAEIQFGNIFLNDDGGYVFAGRSSSDSSGNKTQNNLSPDQTWLVKIDSSGNKIWDRTLLIDGKVEHGYIIQALGGCYIAADFNTGNVGGDKTQPFWGDNDYWIIKLCENPAVLVNFSAPPVLCPGTCTDFLNLSLNATSFQWFFPGATPDTSTAVNPVNICYYTPGDFDVTLIGTDSVTNDTLTLVNYIHVYPFSPPQGIIQTGDTLISNTGFVTYQWFFQGDSIMGATSNSYIALESGDYSMICVDSNGCTVEVVILNVLAGISETGKRKDGIITWPNPVSDRLTIGGSLHGIGSVTVYNLHGAKMRLASADVFPMRFPGELDVSEFPPGIYYLEIVFGNMLYREKFIRK